MAKMTEATIKMESKLSVAELIAGSLENAEAVQVGDFSWAICTDEELNQWTVVSLVAKNRKATKVTDAFDPFVANEMYEAERAEKEAARQAKEAAKAAKLAKRNQKKEDAE